MLLRCGVLVILCSSRDNCANTSSQYLYLNKFTVFFLLKRISLPSFIVTCFEHKDSCKGKFSDLTAHVNFIHYVHYSTILTRMLYSNIHMSFTVPLVLDFG